MNGINQLLELDFWDNLKAGCVGVNAGDDSLVHDDDVNGEGGEDDDGGGGVGGGSLSVALLPLFSQTASTQELDRKDDDHISSKPVRW